eukprot:849077-Amphidinium_carterae.1
MTCMFQELGFTAAKGKVQLPMSKNPSTDGREAEVTPHLLLQRWSQFLVQHAASLWLIVEICSGAFYQSSSMIGGS